MIQFVRQTFIERSPNSVFRPRAGTGRVAAKGTSGAEGSVAAGGSRGGGGDTGPLKDHGWIWQGAQGRVGVQGWPVPRETCLNKGPMVTNDASFTDRPGGQVALPQPAPAGLGADLMAMESQEGRTLSEFSRVSPSTPFLSCKAPGRPRPLGLSFPCFRQRCVLALLQAVEIPVRILGTPEATDTLYTARLRPRGARGSRETARGTVGLKDSGPGKLVLGTAKKTRLAASCSCESEAFLPCLLCDARQLSDPLWAHLEPGNQLATGHLGPYPGSPLPQFPSLCQTLVESKLEMVGGSSLLRRTQYHSGSRM